MSRAAGRTDATTVLALNAGSSSLKFGLYRCDARGAMPAVTGIVETDGDATRTWRVRDGEGGAIDAGPAPGEAPDATIARIAELLAEYGVPAPDAVGHRIVHGGPYCRRHARVDAVVLGQLEAAAQFAPLHVPPALALLRSAQEQFRDSVQVACLDTAFHAGMPDVARTLPLPRVLRDQGIERYGFHGLSCESIVRQLGDDLPARLVIAHLGHGASVTAVADGQSIDTSMGLTPSGGVMMGTRCGDIDPGVLAYLLRERGYDAARIEALIDRESGMRGVSGIGGDMRALRAAAASSPDARLAIAMFCASVRKQVGAMAAMLGGIDLLVFTGGIGENDAATRAAVCERMEAFGLRERSPSVRVLPSLEDEQIARHAWSLLTAA